MQPQQTFFVILKLISPETFTWMVSQAKIIATVYWNIMNFKNGKGKL